MHWAYAVGLVEHLAKNLPVVDGAEIIRVEVVGWVIGEAAWAVCFAYGCLAILHANKVKQVSRCVSIPGESIVIVDYVGALKNFGVKSSQVFHSTYFYFSRHHGGVLVADFDINLFSLFVTECFPGGVSEVSSQLSI